MKFQKITIYSSRLESLKAFYNKLLGLRIIEENSSLFVIQIGTTELKFQYSKYCTPYHIAFNIPSNQEVEALHWLQERVELLKDEGELIVDMPDWNAKGIYFYDPDQNIMELIARKNLNLPSQSPFDSKCFLSVSEIGIPTHNINPVFEMLNKQAGLELHSGDLERFCSVGTDEGLFILVNKTIKKWFPTNDDAFSSNFECVIELPDHTTKQIIFKSGILDVI